ncbi:ankyrin repeat domain-containing protein [Streptomyces sp. NBC_01216]|uniref:ankyrin repeat domain-containing protein n=1 Tax=unclassified Streptomyces TaxID=2593676 RepID=UPI002E0FF02C|nr:ankyrin repeat domain-containing protein [Streptomyces sp. NBC_01216]
MSTLFEGVTGGDEDTVVRALRAGESPEADADGETVLYRAAVANEPGIVRLLLAAGADPGRGSGEGAGDLPLCGAACGGHAEVVRALLAAGARPDEEESYGFTATAWAVRLGHTETVRVLLAHGADPNRPGPDGLTPLVAAARRGSTPSVRTLLEHGAGPLGDALAEARRWIGVDIAAELRRGLLDGYAGGATYESVVRRVPEDGGVTVVVELLRENGAPGSGDERQTGHAAIATLLEGALGLSVPHEELATRALRCGDRTQDDWTEAVAALARRADGETFRAASAWCGSGDTRRQALGADVLAALGGFRAAGLPVLRRLAAGLRPAAEDSGEAAGAAREPALAVVAALGTAGDAAALPELLAFAAHPDAEVRRALGCALTGLVPAGCPGAVEVLVGLSRDPDPGVRDWATLALAELPEDTPPLRAALAERLDDTDPDTVAEAARGLAMRQDQRAVEVLAGILADGDPGGSARDTALAALEHIGNERVRTRLEWTGPRIR